MKKVMLMALAAFFVTAAFAQTIDDAQNEINNENYYKARVILNKLLKDPASDKAQVEYYMGNAYLKDDEADSAKMFYKMVNTGDSKNPLGYLAAGRLGVLAKNSTEAKMNFDRAAQVTKFKNANVFFETGDAYFRPQIFDLAAAIQNLEKANELDGKNTTIMMELGDAYLENSSNDPTMGGKAMTEYENAIAINNKLQLAYIKKGRLDVRGQIYNDAIDAFKKALEIDEKYPIVHKELGEVYYFTKQYDKMIEEFKKYIALSPGDNKARISLLSMLFANKDYDKCVDEANKGLQSDPKNPDYYRFVFYSDYELKRYKDGYDAMKKFMDLPNVTHKPRDIIYAARLANSVSDTTLALQLFPQALANDSANCELMSEYAKALFVARHYDEAIAQYNAKKAKCGDVNSVELYYMGRVYLLLDDSLDADTTFGEFIKRNPTSPDGYYWRARTNLKIGKPEDFLSFPYYDKYVEIAGSDPAKYKNNLIEAYDYLGAYYFEKDKAKSKDYFNKVLELDPNDEFGKEFMKQFR